MTHADTVSAYILDTQIQLFEDARHDLQLPLTEIARQAKLPIGTVNAWAQGRNALSLWGIKKLLRVKRLAPLLSRFFEPEDYSLTAIDRQIDHDGVAADCIDFAAEHARARHPKSPGGVDIVEIEDRALRAKAVRLKAVA